MLGFWFFLLFNLMIFFTLAAGYGFAVWGLSHWAAAIIFFVGYGWLSILWNFFLLWAYSCGLDDGNGWAYGQEGSDE